MQVTELCNGLIRGNLIIMQLFKKIINIVVGILIFVGTIWLLGCVAGICIRELHSLYADEYGNVTIGLQVVDWLIVLAASWWSIWAVIKMPEVTSIFEKTKKGEKK